MIAIGAGLAIPEDELRFTASRSGGPGGQNVNKVSTRVTLRFDLLGSPSLSEAQKRRLASRLAGRINRDGVLALHASRRRSQSANRAEAVERFVDLLREALRPVRARVPTAPTRAAAERRLAGKRRRAEVKRRRSTRPDD